MMDYILGENGPISLNAWDKERQELIRLLRVDREGGSITLYNTDRWKRPQTLRILLGTGLSDAGGEELFEGHIVEGNAIGEKGGFPYFGRIVYLQLSTSHGFQVESPRGDIWDLEALQPHVSLDNITGRIIGNIFENPELMEGNGLCL